VTGLTEAGHHSSARDVAMIAARIIREHPNLRLPPIRSFTHNNIKQDNQPLCPRSVR
jgi:D-alanyl-D-alanine carboxypeptidase (penicillin-binding protein 5/6)